MGKRVFEKQFSYKDTENELTAKEERLIFAVALLFVAKNTASIMEADSKYYLKGLTKMFDYTRKDVAHYITCGVEEIETRLDLMDKYCDSEALKELKTAVCVDYQYALMSIRNAVERVRKGPDPFAAYYSDQKEFKALCQEMLKDIESQSEGA